MNTFTSARLNLSAPDLIKAYAADPPDRGLAFNYDARKFPISAPHDGSRGQKFRRFKHDFITGIAIGPLWKSAIQRGIIPVRVASRNLRDGRPASSAVDMMAVREVEKTGHGTSIKVYMSNQVRTVLGPGQGSGASLYI